MPAHTPLIAEIKNLTRGYTKEKKMFKDFNLSINEGDFILLKGKSGTGKSTLANMLTGYLSTPKKHIYFRYEDIAKMSKQELQEYRRKIGIVFQDTKLIPNLTVKENIKYPLMVYGTEKEKIEKRYQQFIGIIGLKEREDAYAKELSGGEKQKVAIARALMHNPSFVIADEPTGNLDKENSETIADLLIAIRELGNTILLITHDESLITYLTNKNITYKIKEL